MSDDLFEKAQRRQKVEAEGILDQKRFDLATPEAEMTLHEGVQEARRFMKRYPEVIGMGGLWLFYERLCRSTL